MVIIVLRITINYQLTWNIQYDFCCVCVCMFTCIILWVVVDDHVRIAIKIVGAVENNNNNNILTIISYGTCFR